MTDETRPSLREVAQQQNGDLSLETIRQILFGEDQSRIARLEAELNSLDERVTDRDALIATISPVLGDSIRRQIRDSRQEMIEALYPIVGQLVVRAVSEAIRDLARSVDEQVRRSFNMQNLWWRLRARIGGASPAEIALRAALPCEVSQVLLVHQETGLLLWYVARDPAATHDMDLVGSMLTAIRDFSAETFGQGKEGHLDEVEYGDRRILIEGSQNAYLAAVIDGVEPPGFRAEMRERVVEVEHRFGHRLRNYEGDPTDLTSVEEILSPLLAGGQLDVRP